MRRVDSRVILIVALWLSSLALAALALQHEHVGDSSYFTLFIPYENLYFQPRDSVYFCKTEIDLTLLGQDNRSIYHNLSTFKIEIPDNSLIRYRAYPIVFRLGIIDEPIEAYLKITNLQQGTRQQETFTLTPPYPVRNQTAPLYLFQKGDNRFVTQFPFNGALADSVTVVQHFGTVPDSLSIVVEDRVVWRWDDPSNNLSVTLPLENRIYHGISVRSFYGRQSVSSHDHERFFSEYDARYTPEEQIRQMEIIMLSADIQQARMVHNRDLEEYIDLYWKRNDPTPDTAYNENYEIFIHRIMETDKRFSLKGFIPGWKTDQGKILIKYGEPEEEFKEQFPTEVLYPYIIWYYYTIDKRFVFYDKKGFGYYELAEKWYIDRD